MARKTAKARRPARITTMRQLLKVLGGVENIAKHLRTDPTAIEAVESKDRECVTRGHHLQVYLALQGMGYSRATINPKLFGMGMRGWKAIAFQAPA